MTLYERLKEIQALIGCTVQVEVAGHWTDGHIHEIYIGKEIKVTVSISAIPSVQLIQVGSDPNVVSTIPTSLSVELVGVDEIRRRIIG